MSESRNIRIVQDAYAAVERGDIAAVLAFLTDDVQWSIPGPPEVPYAGTRHGRDGAAEFFRLLGESDEVQLFEPRTFLADGDVVAVLG